MRQQQLKEGLVQLKSWFYFFDFKNLLPRQDSNLRPLGYEPNELPDCST